MAKGDDLLISANEREFILRALQENEMRVDGRGPFDARPVSYRFGPKDGVCEVTMGDTRVLAVVSAARTPRARGATRVPSPSTSSSHPWRRQTLNPEGGRGGGRARRGSSAIRETGAVDVESLCVLAGRSVARALRRPRHRRVQATSSAPPLSRLTRHCFLFEDQKPPSS